MASEGTENPYATRGPADTGETWAEYFRRVLHSDTDDSVESADSSESDGGELGAELRGRGVQLSELEPAPKSHLALTKLLISKGFKVREGWYTMFYPGGVYGPSAQKAGEKKPDRTVDTTWMEARTSRAMVRFTYERVNGKNWTCSWRQINGEYRLISDKEMKEFINAQTADD